jgi:hypothetical protein
VGKANGSRECAPDDKLRVPTIQRNVLPVLNGGHGAKSAFAHPTHLHKNKTPERDGPAPALAMTP